MTPKNNKGRPDRSDLGLRPISVTFDPALVADWASGLHGEERRSGGPVFELVLHSDPAAVLCDPSPVLMEGIFLHAMMGFDRPFRENGPAYLDSQSPFSVPSLHRMVGTVAQQIMAERSYDSPFTLGELIRFFAFLYAETGGAPLVDNRSRYIEELGDLILAGIDDHSLTADTATRITIKSLHANLDEAAASFGGSSEAPVTRRVLNQVLDKFGTDVLRSWRFVPERS